MVHGLYLIGYLSPSPSEMLLLMLVALLLFGGELPKVARSWGRSLAEFKKGLAGFQNEFNSVLYDEPPRRIPYHDPVYSHNAGAVEGELAEDESSNASETVELSSDSAESDTNSAEDSTSTNS